MLKIASTLLLSAALINITACSSISGNVVPPSGPAMEKVYDSMKKPPDKQNNTETKEKEANNFYSEDENKENVQNFRAHQMPSQAVAITTSAFHKIPNPELHLYIYPHLAGQAQIPVPGYTTVFNVYEHDHYALSND